MGIKNSWIIFVISIFILGLSFGGSSIKQPIEFSHKKHTEQDIECEACHIYVKEQIFAGIPNVETCLECHSEPITESKEEEKIREYHKKNKKIPWIKINNLPPHVYFSHRRHVAIAKLECKICHGNMGELVKPPNKPLVTLKMGDCIDCHKRKKAKIDCIYCHK
jgi:hypothetical protein